VNGECNVECDDSEEQKFLSSSIQPSSLYLIPSLQFPIIGGAITVVVHVVKSGPQGTRFTCVGAKLLQAKA
jgi:hypothetical protein